MEMPGINHVVKYWSPWASSAPEPSLRDPLPANTHTEQRRAGGTHLSEPLVLDSRVKRGAQGARPSALELPV